MVKTKMKLVQAEEKLTSPWACRKAEHGVSGLLIWKEFPIDPIWAITGHDQERSPGCPGLTVQSEHRFLPAHNHIPLLVTEVWFSLGKMLLFLSLESCGAVDHGVPLPLDSGEGCDQQSQSHLFFFRILNSELSWVKGRRIRLELIHRPEEIVC